MNDPAIIDPSDVVVRIDTSPICGSDLHILKGDVPETTPGTVLVDTFSIPRLIRLVAGGRLDPRRFLLRIGFRWGGTMSAYDTFADAANSHALKVVLQGSERDPSFSGRVAAGLGCGGCMSGAQQRLREMGLLCPYE